MKYNLMEATSGIIHHKRFSTMKLSMYLENLSDMPVLKNYPISWPKITSISSQPHGQLGRQVADHHGELGSCPGHWAACFSKGSP